MAEAAGNGDLCTQCANTDFKRLSKLNYSRSAFIRHLGSIETLRTSNCRLCRSFASLAPRSAPAGLAFENFDLRVFNMNWVFTGSSREPARRNLIGVAPSNWGSKNIRGEGDLAKIRLALEETGYLSLAPSPEDVPMISKIQRVCPKNFDVDLVKSWISYCRDNHSTRCHDPTTVDPPGLHVLDCRTRQVIFAPIGCQYVSLSYVWGRSYPQRAKQQATKTRFQKVIEDSIAVTLMMGMQYLWVDRLCIDQTDKKKQRHQINQMDLIYARSALTIIAAAGYGPERGLPGVNGTFRNPQKQITIQDGTKLISTLPIGRHLVQKSKWNTRGWTYQEGILSTKRLVFTDSQVLFECNGMHCCEAVSFDLDRVHNKTKEMFDMDAYRLGAFGAKTPGTNPHEYMKYVSDFSKRELTYARDTLDAIQGVLNTFTRARNPMHNFWGIPIVCSDGDLIRRKDFALLPKSKTRSRSTRFMINLLWEPSPAYPYGFTRKKEFPSWSWTGWRGKIKDHVSLGNVVNQGIFLDTHVWFSQKHNNQCHSIEWLPLQPGKHILQDVFSSHLLLEANVIPLEIVKVHFSQEEKCSLKGLATSHAKPPGDGFFVKIDTGSGGIIYSELEGYDRQREDFTKGQDSYIAIHSFTEEIMGVNRVMCSSKAMVLERVNHHYERVGLFSLDWVFCRHERGTLTRPSYLSFNSISVKEKVWLG
ncbi:unnamed protein product [Clonostachys rosea]|uniref:Heterokaryon incompatibility domain-containing protein n=1 Tax=Bionectria ochroleuca TaxID=29856 RepID=A0ABY6U1T1_BIOOC|nr:unnamed protein product [Clonostachys rosea]